MVVGIRIGLAVQLEIIAFVEILPVFLGDNSRCAIIKIAGWFELDELAKALPAVIEAVLSLSGNTGRIVAAPKLEVTDVRVTEDLWIVNSWKSGDTAEFHLAPKINCEPARDRSFVDGKEMRRFRLSGTIPETFDREGRPLRLILEQIVVETPDCATVIGEAFGVPWLAVNIHCRRRLRNHNLRQRSQHCFDSVGDIPPTVTHIYSEHSLCGLNSPSCEGYVIAGRKEGCDLLPLYITYRLAGVVHILVAKQTDGKIRLAVVACDLDFHASGGGYHGRCHFTDGRSLRSELDSHRFGLNLVHVEGTHLNFMLIGVGVTLDLEAVHVAGDLGLDIDTATGVGGNHALDVLVIRDLDPEDGSSAYRLYLCYLHRLRGREAFIKLVEPSVVVLGAAESQKQGGNYCRCNYCSFHLL